VALFVASLARLVAVLALEILPEAVTAAVHLGAIVLLGIGALLCLAAPASTLGPLALAVAAGLGLGSYDARYHGVEP
jgi:hypothetical protein